MLSKFLNKKQFYSFFLFLFLLISPVLNVFADSSAPVVKLRYNNDIQTDGAWVLGVKATDNIGITDTTVYYRTRNQKEYASVNSKPAEGYRWLSHFVGYKPTTVYFYVESTDTAGNVTSRGSVKKPMSVKVAPISANSSKQKAAPKASNTVSKDKKGNLDLGDDCRRTSVWNRLGVNSTMTRRTESRNGKQVPVGSSKRMSLSGGRHYFYSTWGNLKIREYDFAARLIDPNGRVAYRGQIKFKSKWIGGGHTWTTWVYYEPQKGDPEGVWRYVVCGDGKLQVDKKIRVVK